MDDPAGPLDPGGHLAATASDCVHCGFCLPACPTYQLWGEEMDSPRGRIHLMSQVLNGTPVTERVMLHVDRCLGCMACVPAGSSWPCSGPVPIRSGQPRAASISSL